LPCVHLIWAKYYRNGKVPGHILKELFWWRGLLKLLNTFKGIVKANFEIGDTILLWSDLWNGSILQYIYPQLYSFAKDNQATVKTILELDSLEDHFHLPLSVEAYQ
jgi:hypothetical protein